MTADTNNGFLGRAQGIDSDMDVFRKKVETADLGATGLDLKGYSSSFDTETLMYVYVIWWESLYD